MVLLYCTMFAVCYKLSERLLREHRNGNTKNDRNLDRTLDVMASCLLAVRTALLHTHKPTSLASAELFKFSHYEDRMEMIVALFLEVVQIRDNAHLFSEICRTLYLFIRLYPESIERVESRFHSLYTHGFSGEKLAALYRPSADLDTDA